jgi:lysine-N-methylase
MPRKAVQELSSPNELPPAFSLRHGASLPWPVPPSPRRPPIPILPFPPAPEREREPDFVRPNYANRFNCISSACEDTCCQGWSVPVDQNTYEKYRSNETLKPHLGSLIVLNTNQPTTSDYARIPLTGDAHCSFLDEQKLCGIQKQLGADMLSVTCQTYPRAVNTNAGQPEAALNLSCPEAARVALLEDNLLPSLPSPATLGGRYASVRHQAGRLRRANEPRLAIRQFALLLIKDRTYPLWQRMYLLGIFSSRLQAASAGAPLATWTAANPQRVAKLLAENARTVSEGRLLPIMAAIQPQPDRQLTLLIEMLKLRFSAPPIPARFVECIQDFESGIHAKTAHNPSEVMTAYADGYKNYYRPLMDKHPHLLENYVTNYILKNSYPFGRQTQRTLVDLPTPEDEHILLCVHLALVQTLLIGMAGHYNEAFDTTHVVKLVQSLARTIEHSQESIDQIKLFARTRNLNNAAGLALLLRQAD